MTKLLTHPSDGDLLTYIDGEASELESHAARAHLETCAVCQQTVSVFRSGSEGVEEMLASVAVPEAPVPPRGRPIAAPTLAIIRPMPARKSLVARPTVRAALILLGIGVGTFAVSPLRAWVLDLFWRGENTPMAPEQDQPDIQAGSATSSSSVSFVPSSEVFEVSLTAPQDSGTLTLVFGEGIRAEGSVRGERGPSLYVTQSGITIANSPGSSASYHLIVPESVRQVVVRVGDVDTRRLVRGVAGSEVVIPLSNEAR